MEPLTGAEYPNLNFKLSYMEFAIIGFFTKSRCCHRYVSVLRSASDEQRMK